MDIFGASCANRICALNGINRGKRDSIQSNTAVLGLYSTQSI